MDMTIQDILVEIRVFLAQNSDNQLVNKYARYFSEGYDAYGVDQKALEKARIHWFETYHSALGLVGFTKLGDMLIRSGKYEEASLAIFFVRQYLPEFTAEDFKHLTTWLDDGIRNWAHTDYFSPEIVAPCIIHKIVPLESIADWRFAASKWKRRAVPVACISLLKAGWLADELLNFIEELMEDDQRVVHQGLGWFLRETWKMHPDKVEKFLLRWKDRCARLIIQYATEKMNAEKKASFKKAKMID